MTHTKIKTLLYSAIDAVSSNVSNYVVNPCKDFLKWYNIVVTQVAFKI